MSLLKKMKAASTTKTASILAESDFFNNTFKIPTRIPALNIALGGSVHAGVVPGLTIFAADSKHFKTNFCLQMVSAFLNSDPDAVCLFYDSEFGVTPAYLKSMDVDPERVLHIPITNVEELKFDVVKKLEAIERGEKVIIFVDSVGNLASKKELEDAINEKSVADMSRAKSLKSLFRIVTPYLTTKNIPMLVVNHVYSEQGCLTPDTLVRMGNNDLKALKDISVGDVVIADDGSKQVVEHVFSSEDLKDSPEKFGMYEIALDNGEKIRCTGNHKFLTTAGEWVEVRNLTMNSEIDCLC